MSAALTLDWSGRKIQIEYVWVGSDDTNAPVMVFLHEGLGSVSLWKTFPDQLCRSLGMRGLVYSRPGYGRSTARAAQEHWDVDFMHRQAYEVLPALLHALSISRPYLFGHSDGASIALLYAAKYSADLRSIIVVAPHILVEDISVESITQAREAYLHQGLREKLARHHDDVDSAFFGWNDIWLAPAFRSWNIQGLLETIRCPVLAIQGEQDEYGTMQQVLGIQDRLPDTEVIALPACGHSPHREQTEAVLAAVTAFVHTHSMHLAASAPGLTL